jgi:CheY-like chemotaxis protein
MLAHGGSIKAESLGPKKGATFTVDLPLRESVPMSSSVASPSVPSGGLVLRILLVEDHDDTRVAIERLLRHLRHEFRSVKSAQEALELAAQYEFDVVLSDLGLPDENGWELMSKLRDRFGLRGIAVTGYGMQEDIERSREAGFIHHLTKPIDPNRLGELLCKIA